MLDDVRLDRKIRWAANLFIWSAVVVLVVSGFTFFNDWHPSYSSSIEAVGSLFSFLAVRLLYNDWFYILVLVNALVLRRYKSRLSLRSCGKGTLDLRPAALVAFVVERTRQRGAGLPFAERGKLVAVSREDFA